MFWLIEPTDENLRLFEEWTTGGQQQNVFFADLVEECHLVELEEGNTFMIPSGWIHGVYTPADSLVFGGNFLHSFAIEMQLKVKKIEQRTRVDAESRFPSFNTLSFYILDRYVCELRGKSFMTAEYGRENRVGKLFPKQETVHLTKLEFNGLKALIQYLSRNKTPVDGITNHKSLLKEAKLMIEDHKDDDAELAITGLPVASWQEADLKQDSENSNTKLKAARQGGAARKRKIIGEQSNFNKYLS